MPLRLESFGTAPPDAAPADPADEDARLAAYEAGYTAGWEDAGAARQDDRSQAEDAVIRNLQTLGFTLQQAQRHVLLSLRPLLEAVAEQIVPALSREGIGAVVRDALLPLAEDMAKAPVLLRLNPASRATVEAMLPTAADMTVTVVEDATLTPGQVVLAVGSGGARVDLDAAGAAITAAIRDFYTLLPSERPHG